MSRFKYERNHRTGFKYLNQSIDRVSLIRSRNGLVEVYFHNFLFSSAFEGIARVSELKSGEY